MTNQPLQGFLLHVGCMFMSLGNCNQNLYDIVVCSVVLVTHLRTCLISHLLEQVIVLENVPQYMTNGGLRCHNAKEHDACKASAAHETWPIQFRYNSRLLETHCSIGAPTNWQVSQSAFVTHAASAAGQRMERDFHPWHNKPSS